VLREITNLYFNPICHEAGKNAILLSEELYSFTFLSKFGISYGSTDETPFSIKKMSLKLKFRGSVTRIVTDILLSSEPNSPIVAKGLWDSGAMTCCIKKSLSDSLNLLPIDIAKDAVMVGRPATDRDVVQLDVQVSDKIKFHELKVVVLPDEDMPSTDFIIGMNLINKGLMTIDGTIPGYTLFAFDDY
jgi:hypothetical protein